MTFCEPEILLFENCFVETEHFSLGLKTGYNTYIQRTGLEPKIVTRLELVLCFWFFL